MIGAVRAFRDRVLGRGHSAVTVPVFDGALKSNNILEHADIFAAAEQPEDIASDGRNVFLADGSSVLRFDGDVPHELHRFDQTVTAIACMPGDGIAVALDGRSVRILGGAHDGRHWETVAGQTICAANAISVGADGRLLVTDGSSAHSVAEWKYDLMSLGRSGRLLELNPADGSGRELATGLAHAFGASAVGDDVWVSESWRHRVMAHRHGKPPRPVTDALPGYPSRISPAAGGGYWLTCFTLRTQLVEFVLREHAFRARMMAEIEPLYWIAPAETSGNTFLEPMQGAQLKMMGVVKPWAPPRSYGLVIRLDARGFPQYSLHSRFDGHNHGVVSAVECAGYLYVLARGRKRLLRLRQSDLDEAAIQ